MAEHGLKDKIRVLHVVKDDKFFDSVIDSFDSDERLENRSILVVDKPNYKFFRIKKTEKVEIIVGENSLKKHLRSHDYDVLFFHSLTFSQYHYHKYIPSNIVVIWWCWGFELYLNNNGAPPLFSVELYKPKTKKLLEQESDSFRTKLKNIIKEHFLKYYYVYQRGQLIRRVDFFQPVISIEYDMMKNIKGFHAEEFYYPQCFTSYQMKIASHNSDGGILIGNSATFSNNHLDVWDSVRNYIPEGRDVIFPLNYPNADYAEYLSSQIKSENHKLNIVRDYLPRDEYFNLVDSCSYAVFGVIRQQAMGNVYHCLFKGMKVFLYKDSIVYKYLKKKDYVVFAIEEITERSFREPLTKEDVTQNAFALKQEKKYIDKVRESAFEKIREQINEKN